MRFTQEEKLRIKDSLSKLQSVKLAEHILLHPNQIRKLDEIISELEWFKSIAGKEVY